jgi:hypothetical protein
MQSPTMTWAVEYVDGTHLEQYDSSGTEVPYRAINWPQVQSIRFVNQYAETKLDIRQPAPGYKVSLRSRHFTGLNMLDVMTFVLLVSAENKEIDADSVVEAIYCMPDGAVHQCYMFDCPEIRERCSKLQHGKPTSISAGHVRLNVGAEATIA